MNSEYVTFDKFPNQEMAEALGKFFEEKGIDYIVTDESSSLDASFTGNRDKEFRLKLKQQDFEKAHKAIEDSVLGELNDLPEGYYLLSFSDDELLDVVAAKDEWSAFDFMLARKLLKDRGNQISEAELAQMRSERIAELSKPEKIDNGVLAFGWFTTAMGGFAGIVVGWYISSHRKTLPNGQMVYAFDAHDRKKGKRMIFASVASMAIWAAVLAYRNLSHSQSL